MTNPYTLGYQDGLNYRRHTDTLTLYPGNKAIKTVWPTVAITNG